MNVDVNKKYENEYLINFIDKLNLTDIDENISDVDKFTNLLGKFQVSGINPLFELSTYRDDDISEKILINLGMEETLYKYFIGSMVPDIFKDYIKDVLTTINEDVDEKTIESIFELESSLGMQ